MRWHLLAWLAVAGYLLLGDYFFHQASARGLWLRASFLVASITEFYFCYLLVYPRLLQPGYLRILLAGLVSAAFLFVGVRYLLDEVLYPAVLGFHNYSFDTTFFYYLGDNTYYAIPILVLAATIWASQVSLRREYENKLLATEKRAAELAFLKTQINPHFLYNTLNMLYGLAYSTNKTLAGGLLQLAELMRYMLHNTAAELVAIKEEVDYLEHYLALYRLRYAEHLHASLLVEGSLDDHWVAPLLFIPFVENAFKHGVLDDPATPVRMHLRLRPGVVEFTVENYCHDYQADATSGIGLANLRHRLAILYSGRHTLEVGAVGSRYRAYLQLHDEASFQPPPAARRRH